MENKFVDGLFVSRRENAPDYVISNLSFNQKFIDFLQAKFNAKGYVNIDLMKSKEGKLYAKLNDWKPQETFVKKDGKIEIEDIEKTYGEHLEDDIRVENIPF